MALKPTIYKAQIELADSDSNRYETLGLTLARHPSETMERMAACWPTASMPRGDWSLPGGCPPPTSRTYGCTATVAKSSTG